MVSNSTIQTTGGRSESPTTSTNRKNILGLSVLLLAASIFAAYWWVSDSFLRLQIAFAEEQTAIFEQMKTQARTGDASVAVGCLEYTIHYYPSGTKQTQGSRLDQIVERARRNTIQEIVADLRTKTGADHGDDPQQWINALRASDE